MKNNNIKVGETQSEIAIRVGNQFYTQSRLLI